MTLEFVNHLSLGQIIDLINYCCYKPFPTINKLTFPADKIREYDGRQYLKVSAWMNERLMSEFLIGDFTIQGFSNGRNGFNNEELREYMTSIFGKEYIGALRNYYDSEIERLENQLGTSRK